MQVVVTTETVLATAAITSLTSGAIAGLLALWIKARLADFLEKLNGRYLRSDLAHEKFSAIEQQLQTIRQLEGLQQ